MRQAFDGVERTVRAAASCASSQTAAQPAHRPLRQRACEPREILDELWTGSHACAASSSGCGCLERFGLHFAEMARSRRLLRDGRLDFQASLGRVPGADRRAASRTVSSAGSPTFRAVCGSARPVAAQQRRRGPLPEGRFRDRRSRGDLHHDLPRRLRESIPAAGVASRRDPPSQTEASDRHLDYLRGTFKGFVAG
jgi:hypothetical protein